MSANLLISAAFLPALFWAAYHYHHDRHRPEPVANLIITLALGAAASLIAHFGYSAAASLGATGSGLMQYPMPIFASVLLSLPFVFLVVWVVLEFFERRYDGYKAVHGYGLEHPYNKAREYL